MKKPRFKRIIFIIFILLVLPIFATWVLIAQPTITKSAPSDLTIDSDRLKAHVVKLSKEYFPRSYKNIENLDRCAEYIRTHFQKAGANIFIQEFTVRGKRYQNVIGYFGNKGGERIVVGAHYDAFINTPGADDNASGVSGLIELAYLLGKEKIKAGIELVAYSLEEPPFFATEDMGSARHARLIHDQKVKVKCMIALEMIGYFSSEPGSQLYPMPVLKLFYPNKGNAIAIVGRLDQRKIVRKIKRLMKGAADLPVYSVNAPLMVTGIDYSDHSSYWRYGYDAVMITDTAFYRNLEYHTPNDTADRLNYELMAKAVIQVFEAVKGLATEILPDAGN
jgi:Zn-dependent M28 family amino/carboxypeptidase